MEADDAGIGIPASDISIRYRRISVPDWVPLIRYRSTSDIAKMAMKYPAIRIKQKNKQIVVGLLIANPFIVYST
jgi:hypothetical protein